MELQVNKNNDKSWIWDCPADYSEDPSKPSADVYAIRFNSVDGTCCLPYPFSFFLCVRPSLFQVKTDKRVLLLR